MVLIQEQASVVAVHQFKATVQPLVNFVEQHQHIYQVVIRTLATVQQLDQLVTEHLLQQHLPIQPMILPQLLLQLVTSLAL